MGNTVKYISIKFDNGIEENLSRNSTNFQLMRGIFVQRHRFAVTLSYAIAIHKAQGLRLNCAIIDNGPSTFGSGRAYVRIVPNTSTVWFQFDHYLS